MRYHKYLLYLDTFPLLHLTFNLCLLYLAHVTSCILRILHILCILHILTHLTYLMHLTYLLHILLCILDILYLVDLTHRTAYIPSES